MHSLKAIASILLMCTFAAQTFNQGVIVASYYCNTSAYEKNCENKARPALHCHGKCQMAKELKKEEQKNDQNTERKLVNKVEVVSSKSFFITSLCVDQCIADASSLYAVGSSRLIPCDIFHPPTLA